MRPLLRTVQANHASCEAFCVVGSTHPTALHNEVINMNGNPYYGIRIEGAKYGVGFGSALAIAISYTSNHSILWAIIHGILGWLYVIYFGLFR